MKQKIIYEVNDIKRLLRSVPSGTMVLFCVSVVLMNLLANKEIYTGVSWLALDCGLLVSWLSFLCMDIMTKRFGPKAAVKLSLFAVCVNLCVCGMLKVVALVPGNWGEFYAFENELVNQVLNNTVGGTWYVLLGSTLAMLVASVVNAVLNHSVGKLFRKDTFTAYAVRSYVSTMFAQFVDNFVFSLMVSHVFFGWTLLQCITCSITGCLVELLCEVIFSPVGYRVCRHWERERVGAEYVEVSRCE